MSSKSLKSHEFTEPMPLNCLKTLHLSCLVSKCRMFQKPLIQTLQPLKFSGLVVLAVEVPQTVRSSNRRLRCGKWISNCLALKYEKFLIFLYFLGFLHGIPKAVIGNFQKVSCDVSKKHSNMFLWLSQPIFHFTDRNNDQKSR